MAPNPDPNLPDGHDHDDEAEFDAGEEVLAEILEAGATDVAVLDEFYREVGVDIGDRPWRTG